MREDLGQGRDAPGSHNPVPMTDSPVTTAGVRLRTRSRPLREAVELLSSMRFAIALLTVISIASVVGTVVVQHQPMVNYVNQFGPFWAEGFDALRLYAIYSAWWFLLILAFLVISTSLCIVRQTPKIMADLRTYKEHVRAQSLQAFHHKAQGSLDQDSRAAFERVSAWLLAHGWKVKAQQRDAAPGAGIMVAARKGAANKLGYLSAHGAIVLICIGGLFDGDLMVRAQLWWQDKAPYTGGGLIADVPPQHRLSPSNPTYRGNLFVSEGTTAGAAVLNLANGVVIQDLPFAVELKKFIVEYYPTGMPRLFASEILVHDPARSEPVPFRVEVNKPAVYQGVAIYQSSFDDGGSRVRLTAHPLGVGGAAGKPFEIDTTVGASTMLTNQVEQLQLEVTGLRTINVENFSAGPGGAGTSATDVRRVDLVGAIESRLGSGAKTLTPRELRNVGPSITYKLRDAAGQAHEFHHYMLPVEIDGQRVFLAGVRQDPNEEFRYLRVPADEQDGLDGWLRLERALHDPAMRALAVQRYVAHAVAPERDDLREQLRASAARVLSLFAGAEAAASDAGPGGGLQAVADFMERSVPEADRQRTSDVLVRILNGVLLELLQASREAQGLAPLPADETTQDFLTQAVLSLSDSFFYPSPVYVHLRDFNHVQASVFQVARAPGQNLVYLGCALLIIGVFAMLYVRERRLWVWLEDAPGGTRATMALSSTRQTLDMDHEFERLRKAVFKESA